MIGDAVADLCGIDHVDRLPIIVAGSGVCQLLKVSKITGGAGKNQATAVLQALEECSLQERVVGMCFDTCFDVFRSCLSGQCNGYAASPSLASD